MWSAWSWMDCSVYTVRSYKVFYCRLHEVSHNRLGQRMQYSNSTIVNAMRGGRHTVVCVCVHECGCVCIADRTGADSCTQWLWLWQWQLQLALNEPSSSSYCRLPRRFGNITRIQCAYQRRSISHDFQLRLSGSASSSSSSSAFEQLPVAVVAAVAVAVVAVVVGDAAAFINLCNCRWEAAIMDDIFALGREQTTLPICICDCTGCIYTADHRNISCIIAKAYIKITRKKVYW